MIFWAEAEIFQQSSILFLVVLRHLNHKPRLLPLSNERNVTWPWPNRMLGMVMWTKQKSCCFFEGKRGGGGGGGVLTVKWFRYWLPHFHTIATYSNFLHWITYNICQLLWSLFIIPTHLYSHYKRIYRVTSFWSVTW